MQRVSDISSNWNDNLVHVQRNIGKPGSIKFTVFSEAYRHKKKKKSVEEIVEATELSRTQVLKALSELERKNLIHRVRENGALYAVMDEGVRKLKNPAINNLKAGKSTDAIPTKVNPSAVTVGRTALDLGRKATGKRGAKKLRLAIFLSTPIDPIDGDILDLGREFREIQQAVERSRQRSLELFYAPDANLGRIIEILNDIRPNAVHFSGHSSPSDIEVSDPTSRIRKEISKDTLVELFESTDTKPQLLLLNSCCSFEIAEACSKHVKYTIGTTDFLDDELAIYFARSFYSALSGGQSVAVAFSQAKLLCKDKGFSEVDIYELIT